MPSGRARAERDAIPPPIPASAHQRVGKDTLCIRKAIMFRSRTVTRSSEKLPGTSAMPFNSQRNTMSSGPQTLPTRLHLHRRKIVVHSLAEFRRARFFRPALPPSGFLLLQHLTALYHAGRQIEVGGRRIRPEPCPRHKWVSSAPRQGACHARVDFSAGNGHAGSSRCFGGIGPTARILQADGNQAGMPIRPLLIEDWSA